MKKMLNLSTELNAAIRIEAMNRGTTANALIVELLEREYMNKKNPKKEEQEQKPVKDDPVKDEPKKNTVAHIRKGEPIEEHKNAARFLQRKQHPKGILSNGECLRVSTEEGYKYAYFAEDLIQHLDEPF